MARGGALLVLDFIANSLSLARIRIPVQSAFRQACERRGRESLRCRPISFSRRPRRIPRRRRQPLAPRPGALRVPGARRPSVVQAVGSPTRLARPAPNWSSKPLAHRHCPRVQSLAGSPRSMWIWTALSTPATTAILRNRLRGGLFWTVMTVTGVPRLGAPERRSLGLAKGFVWPQVQGADRGGTA